MRRFNGSTDYEFNTCNKIFIGDIQPRECMTKLLRDELEVLDLKDSVSARNHINTWVENTTKRHIKDFLPEDAIDEKSKLILVSYKKN